MTSRLRRVARGGNSESASNFSLTRKGAKFWNALPWKSLDVSNANLGEFDDSVFFGLEELDGNAFVTYKNGLQEESNEDAAVEQELDEQHHTKSSKKADKKKRKRETVEAADEQINNEEVVTVTKKSKKEKKSKQVPAVETEETIEKPEIKEASNVSEGEKKKNKKKKTKMEKDPSTEKIEKKTTPKRVPKKTQASTGYDTQPYDLETTGSWGGVELKALLCKALCDLDFVKPTPIQSVAIPKIIGNCMDMVGVAETGSGKTLAFGIPIINFLLENWDMYRQSPVPAAMIISPTRELAMQTTTVLTDVCKAWKNKAKHIDQRINISIAAVVGGMSEHKQKRLLSQIIHIIVATPGRLCEVMEDETLSAFQDLSRLKFLVVDEADRIMEEGHFSELNRVFSRIRNHEAITERGEDVRVVMWRQAKGVAESNADDEQQGEDRFEEVLDVADPKALLARLGPTADEIDRLIQEQKARGEVIDRPYDEDEDEDEEIEEAAEAVQEEDMDVEENEEEDGEEDEILSMDIDDNEDLDNEDGDDDENDDDNSFHSTEFTPHDMPTFPALPPSQPMQRQTLLFSATGLSARANLHASEIAQLKKLKLKGTIVGVVSDFLLPLSLKKLFSEVGIQKRIEMVDATRSLKNPANKTATSDANIAVTGKNKDSKSKKVVEEEKEMQYNENEKSAVSVLPRQLSQYEIRVPAEDKDIYLYYYLAQNPSRRIVIFVNSIKTCRRVDGLLRAMGLPCKPLHAELPQRNRLQNLDFLKNQPQAILVCTDVAARGVDVDRIACVVHYDIARSPQVYIHRSGRTARNGQTGTTLSLIAPEDLAAHQVITKYLFSYQRLATNNTPTATTAQDNSTNNAAATPMITQNAMPVYTVQMLLIPALRERVLLARKIFSLSAQQTRASKDAHWAMQQAREAGLLAEDEGIDTEYAVDRGQFDDIDGQEHRPRGEGEDDIDGDDINDGSRPLSKQAKRELAILKQELQTLLERPLGSLTGAMRSSTGLILHHQQYEHAQKTPSQQKNMRKHGKKARKTKSSAALLTATNDWRKRKNGFFVYAR